MTNLVTIAALAFGLLGFVTGFVALRTLSRLRASVALLSRGASGRENILEVTEKHMAASEAVRKDVLDLQRDMVAAQAELAKVLAAQQTELKSDLVSQQTSLTKDLVESQTSIEKRVLAERKHIAQTVHNMQQSVGSVLRRIALVRYDAFDDLGGRLSFSLAIMDDSGSGVTLTSIASGTESRIYAKALSNGIGEHALSPEEEQAVKAAMSR